MWEVLGRDLGQYIAHLTPVHMRYTSINNLDEWKHLCAKIWVRNLHRYSYVTYT